MADCGLNLPCTQTVPIETDISALQITNSGEQGRAIEGSNTLSRDAAVFGTNTAPSGIGVMGVGTGASAGELYPAGIGVFGQSDLAAGVQGQCGSTLPFIIPGNAGVLGVCSPTGSTPTGNGVVGVSSGPIDHSGTYGNGVLGSSTTANGVAGTSTLNFTSGVLGVNTNSDTSQTTRYGVAGIGGTASYSVAVFGLLQPKSNGWAGLFQGKVGINGKTYMANSGFQIDHPLEPHAKYLNHSAVESQEMKNVYDGIITLDSQGSAWVELPAWFEALNRDFRYQLTPIGSCAPLYVAQEIVNNRFQVAGGKPHQRISWLVTGIRRDVWAEKNPIVVEEDKDHADQGKFLHPLEAGHPREMGIPYSRTKALEIMAEGVARAHHDQS